MNVLVVEDQPTVREVLVAVASYALKGSRIEQAGDLESALKLAAATKMDAVLLDLGLPGCSGVDSVTRFHAAFPNVAIIVVSSNEDSEVVAAALRAGASGYLPKGLSPTSLLKELAGARLGQRPQWLVPELARSLSRSRSRSSAS